MIVQALAYAARGWFVFPLKPKSKGASYLEHGFKGATPDADQVTRWWTQWPDANIGIACGPSYLTVLDIDVKPGVDGRIWLAGQRPLPETYQVATGSGTGGCHYYFRSDPKLGRKIGIAPGVDILGAGGLVVAPPSIHATGRRYQVVHDAPLAEWPEWLTPKTERPVLVAVPEAVGSRYADRAIEGIAADLRAAVEGTRNDTLNRTAFRGGQLVGAGLAAEATVRDALLAASPLPEEETLRTLNSGLEAGKKKPRTVRIVPRDGKSALAIDGHSISLASCLHVLEADALRHLAMGEGRLRFNSMTLNIELEGKPIDDFMITEFRVEAERWIKGVSAKREAKDIAFKRETAEEALGLFASRDAFNPVVEYLESLPPAEPGAIEQMCSDALHLGEEGLDRLLIRKWLISCVARAIDPGCKVDTVLVLCGKQAKKKSSFFATMASIPWFSDGFMDIENKDALLALRATWIFEWQELAAVQKSRTRESVKAFIASTVDKFRPPYGRVQRDFPRSCVIVGTSNEDSFLSDPTGNRRFWPIRIEKEIDIEQVAKLRDAVWAEALAAMRAGEKWFLEDADADDLEDVHKEFVVHDVWEEAIAKALPTTGTHVTISQLMRSALDLDSSQQHSGNQQRIAAILKSLGWVRCRRKQISPGIFIVPWVHQVHEWAHAYAQEKPKENQ